MPGESADHAIVAPPPSIVGPMMERLEAEIAAACAMLAIFCAALAGTEAAFACYGAAPAGAKSPSKRRSMAT
jgi:hypothetical protein